MVVLALAVGVPLLFAAASVRNGPITDSWASTIWAAIALTAAAYGITALSWVTVDERGVRVVTFGLGRRHDWAEVTSVDLVERHRPASGAQSGHWQRAGDKVVVEIAIGPRTLVPFATWRTHGHPIPGIDTGPDDLQDLSDLVQLARRYIPTGARP